MVKKPPLKQLQPVTVCPYSNGTNITEAKQRFVSPVDDGMHGSVLYHAICLECGSVVRSYIKDIAPFENK